jgi:hypothetical protein
MNMGGKAPMDQERGNSSLKSKPQQPDGPILDFEWPGFPRIDRVRLGFKIYFVLEIFSHIRVKEL